MSQKKMYGPCPCGSGKKYKFCCYLKRSEQADLRQKAAFWAGVTPKIKEENPYEGMDMKAIDKAYETCQKGVVFMNRSEFDRAIPIFRKAMSISQDVHTSANNLAVCLYVTGKIDEACDVQRENIEASAFENPFGWANLAVLEYIRGNEDEARRCVDTAVELESPSADASIQVCQALARFERHQDILDYIDVSGYSGDRHVCFYTGVAAANLGDKKRAKRDLGSSSGLYHKTALILIYRYWLDEGDEPHTVRGNWLYFSSEEICAEELLQTDMKRNEDAWLQRRVLVDYYESLLNQYLDNEADYEYDDEEAEDLNEIMGILFRVTHPRAEELCWAIVKGSLGPDWLRMQALQTLHERGCVDPQMDVEMLLAGKRRNVELIGTAEHSEFRFTPPLPHH